MQPINRYRDRTEAGQALARHFAGLNGQADVVILALPRGGVPVAVEVARAVGAPLDVFVVRKLGLPGHPELAMGAIATGGAQLLDEETIRREAVTPAQVADVVGRESRELARREKVYRGDRPAVAVAGRHVVLIDDGVATGYTLRVAILALRQLGPAVLSVGIPVGAPDTCETLATAVDTLVCPLQPSPFHAVGLWYDHFPALTDDEVSELLRFNPAKGSDHG